MPIIKHLVVDSSAFIHRGPIKETGENIYTCPEVINEIKDEATRDSLRVPGYELKLLRFHEDDLATCVEFSKKTGDYRQLSSVDLCLIAATYRLEREHNGFKFIRKEPEKVVVSKLGRTILKPQLNIPKEIDIDEDDDGSVMIQEDDTDEDNESEESGSSSNEEDGWIGPDNLSVVKSRLAGQSPAVAPISELHQDRVLVACMTSDFSIQNCLLQMGLLAVSPVDGLMIREAKRIALRCHACLKVFQDPSAVKGRFCPQCGNPDTLKRVHYVVEADGTTKVLINFKRPIKVKGTNQQLPKPRGGKHANNPIMTADQRVRRDKVGKFIVNEKKTVNAEHILHDPAYLVRNNPFSYRDEWRPKSCK